MGKVLYNALAWFGFLAALFLVFHGVSRVVMALSAPASDGGRWDSLRESVAPMALTSQDTIQFQNSSGSVLLTMVDTGLVTVEVADFEGRGIMRIGLLDSRGVFHLSPDVCGVPKP